MNVNVMGNYYEDFESGDEIHHALSKTIFESDNNLFSLLTMNTHPLHTNADYAAAQVHGKILVVGTLIFSLTVGLTVMDISGQAIANLGYEEIKHLAPAFIGDTLYARTKILDKRISRKNAGRGIFYVETIGYNQEYIDVISFKRHILVKCRLD